MVAPVGRPRKKNGRLNRIAVMGTLMTLMSLIANVLFGGETLGLMLLDEIVLKANATVTDKKQLGVGSENVPKPSNSGNLGRSIIVVEEDYVSPSFFNQTDFEIEYFDSKPACSNLSAEGVDFTLTTQLSLDRLWIMEHHCARWPAPHQISITVYLPKNTTRDRDYIIDKLENRFRCDLRRMRVAIVMGISAKDQYPVNTLRNIAIQAVATSHAVYVDSDFLISDGLHEDLMKAASMLAKDHRTAAVVPAFEYQSNCKGPKTKHEQVRSCLDAEWDSVPKTKTDLLAILDRPEYPRVERGFEKMNGKNIHHGTTMYKTWIKNQTEPLYIPCNKGPGYEPYMAFRVCNELPRFPQAFKGWGWNKIIWIKVLLKKLGYKLIQISDGFVVHIPHEASYSRKQTDGHPAEFDPYLNWLTSIPAHPDRLPFCTDWKKQHGRLQP